MLERIFKYRISAHILYWLVIIIAYPIYALGYGADLTDSLIRKLCFLPVQMLASYLLIYIQIPLFIYKRRYGLFLLSLIAAVYIFPVTAHLVDDFIVSFLLPPNNNHLHSFIEIISEPILVYYQLTAFLIPVITAAVKIVKQSFEETQALEALEREKAEAELRFLKAQIHPQFLFSTLDHLYTLSRQKSDLAPELVIKLSEMLDYMLYQGQAPKVPIEKEIELLQHYLDLEALRFGEKFEYQFEKNLAHLGTEIIPLILLSVLEFTLKGHSIENHSLTKVKLSIASQTDHIHFQLMRSANDGTYSEEELSKLNRQLMLSYPDKNKLEVIPQNDGVQIDLFLYF